MSQWHVQSLPAHELLFARLLGMLLKVLGCAKALKWARAGYGGVRFESGLYIDPIQPNCQSYTFSPGSTGGPAIT
jgi:hypothetical protein